VEIKPDAALQTMGNHDPQLSALLLHEKVKSDRV